MFRVRWNNKRARGINTTLFVNSVWYIRITTWCDSLRECCNMNWARLYQICILWSKNTFWFPRFKTLSATVSVCIVSIHTVPLIKKTIMELNLTSALQCDHNDSIFNEFLNKIPGIVCRRRLSILSSVNNSGFHCIL